MHLSGQNRTPPGRRNRPPAALSGIDCEIAVARPLTSWTVFTWRTIYARRASRRWHHNQDARSSAVRGLCFRASALVLLYYTHPFL